MPHRAAAHHEKVLWRKEETVPWAPGREVLEPHLGDQLGEADLSKSVKRHGRGQEGFGLTGPWESGSGRREEGTCRQGPGGLC